MQRTYHIAWDNTLAANDRAGTGVYAHLLPEALSRVAGLSVTMLAAAPAGACQNLLQRGSRFLRGLHWTHYSLPRVLEKQNFDLVHSPAFVAPTSAPCPVIVTIHDVSYRLFPEHFPWWWSAYLQKLVPKVLQTAAAVVTVSEHSKQDIVLHYRIPAKKVHVIYNGVDHSLFHPYARMDCRLASKLGLRPGYVLHVGSLAHRKNIPTLLRATALLKAQGKWGKRQLVLAGPHMRSLPGHSEISKLILVLGLQNDVVLTGYLAKEEVAGIYTGASLLVMPSFYEGFGFPLVEAMAAGTPVIASNVSSIPEVCGQAALLFSPHSIEELAVSMDSVLGNPSLAREMKQKGLQRVQQFTWERAAETPPACIGRFSLDRISSRKIFSRRSRMPENIGHLRRKSLPTESGSSQSHSISRNVGAELTVGNQQVHGIGEGLGLERREKDRIFAVGEYILNASSGGNQHRPAASHCFQHSESPSLVVVRKDKSVTSAIKVGDFVIGYSAREGDCDLQPQLRSELPEGTGVLGVGVLRARKEQANGSSPLHEAGNGYDGIFKPSMGMKIPSHSSTNSCGAYPKRSRILFPWPWGENRFVVLMPGERSGFRQSRWLGPAFSPGRKQQSQINFSVHFSVIAVIQSFHHGAEALCNRAPEQ